MQARRSAVVGFGVLVACLAVLLLTGPWSYVVLASGSMEPWASSGDLLLHRVVDVDDLERGDVVTVQRPDGRLVTHRVVQITEDADAPTARLKGDRSRLPDPAPVALPPQVPRVELVVPVLGDVLTVGAPLFWGAALLLVVGGAALLVARGDDLAADAGDAASPPDPRVEALLATCEQLEEDGVDPVVLRDVVRVRAAALRGLPSAERSGAVMALDDGARFYVIACADADPDALALVPVTSARRRDGSDAIERWWRVVRRDLPTATAAALTDWTDQP